MTFYSPMAFFYLAAIPVIIILYLLKQRHRDFQVSSLYLWQEVLRDIEANAPWQKLRKNLLMVLQIAAMLLLVLALARPFLNAAGGKAGNVILILDTSLSMQATDVKPSRFEAGKKQASSYITNLSPGTLVTLVSMGDSAVIEENLSSDKSRLLEAVNRLQVTNGIANHDDAASLIQSIVKQYPGAEVVLYGDEKLEVPGVHIKFSRLSQNGDNYAVTAISHAVATDGITVLSRIANYGSGDAVIPVSLYADGKVFDARDIEVTKGETANIYWEDVPQGTSLIECRIDLSDSLDADNTAWTAVNAVKANKVMLVSNRNLFIEKALSVMNGVELYKTGADGAAGLKGYDLYIFDGYLPPTLPEDGSIMVFNPPANSFFTVDGEIVLPVVKQTGHELLEHMDGQAFSIGKASRLELPDWGETVLDSDEGVIAFAGMHEKSRLVAFGFDLHNTDLPLTPAFPILMANALEWLVPPGIENVESIFPGQAIEFNLAPKTEQAAVKTPSGETVKVAPPFPAAIFDRTGETGKYTLEQQFDGGGSFHYFTVNVPAGRESNLLEEDTPSSPDGAEKPEAGREDIETGLSLQGILLFLALLLLCIEWWVYSNGI